MRLSRPAGSGMRQTRAIRDTVAAFGAEDGKEQQARPPAPDDPGRLVGIAGPLNRHRALVDQHDDDDLGRDRSATRSASCTSTRSKRFVARSRSATCRSTSGSTACRSRVLPAAGPRRRTSRRCRGPGHRPGPPAARQPAGRGERREAGLRDESRTLPPDQPRRSRPTGGTPRTYAMGHRRSTRGSDIDTRVLVAWHRASTVSRSRVS